MSLVTGLPVALRLADMDDDGTLDVVVLVDELGNGDDRVVLIRGDGAGGLVDATSTALPYEEGLEGIDVPRRTRRRVLARSPAPRGRSCCRCSSSP